MLKYQGGGFFHGVPARDLSDEEVEALGGDVKAALLRSGLYVEDKGKPQPAENKQGAGPSENKGGVNNARN